MEETKKKRSEDLAKAAKIKAEQAAAAKEKSDRRKRILEAQAKAPLYEFKHHRQNKERGQ